MTFCFTHPLPAVMGGAVPHVGSSSLMSYGIHDDSYMSRQVTYRHVMLCACLHLR